MHYAYTHLDPPVSPIKLVYYHSFNHCTLNWINMFLSAQYTYAISKMLFKNNKKIYVYKYVSSLNFN